MNRFRKKPYIDINQQLAFSLLTWSR